LADLAGTAALNCLLNDQMPAMVGAEKHLPLKRACLAKCFFNRWIGKQGLQSNCGAAASIIVR
jgi:hypothetical protein